MNKVWKFIVTTGQKLGSKAKLLWNKVGMKSTSKIAAWAGKNKSWLQAVGLASVSGVAGALASRIVSAYVDNKESVAARWMDATGESTPEGASRRKRVKAIGELRDLINKYAAYGESDKDDEYMRISVRILELTNMLIHNESDEEVRRVGIRASILIPSCLDVGQIPEEGFSNEMVIRSMRNLSEDNLSAEDIEGSMDALLDIAESGAPLKSV